MLLSAEAFGKSLDPPLTKQRIYQLINTNVLPLIKKKIDTEHPTVKNWLVNRRGIDHAPKPPNTRSIQPPSTKGEVDLDEILANFADLNIHELPKAALDKIRIMEVALKTRVERQHKRRELIERSLVQSVFGRLYQIDSNSWRTMGAALAPEVAGALGVDEPERVLVVEQMIDDKVMKTLAHVQRLLNDALKGWGVEE